MHYTCSSSVLLMMMMGCLMLDHHGALGYSVWPHPQVITRGPSQVTLSPSAFKFTTTSQSQVLKSAIARYQVAVFPFAAAGVAPQVPQLSSIVINIETTNEELQLGVNENYTLTVDLNGAIIKAVTVFGAMRGLESFAQLVDFNYTSKIYTIEEIPIFVDDYPRFPWRGLMIDTGRHFLQVDTILTMIDAIAYNKMNTLHWHATDTQSFPMQSSSFPKLAIDGAYTYPEYTYSHENIATIVNYAYERGVRVVPEFDIPGHSYSWGLGYPNITLDCSIPDWGTNGVTLDITNPYTYEVLDGFLGEMKSLFMDSFMHLGSDEVNYQCWNMTPAVLHWMEENGITTFPMLEQYFENNLEKITTKHQIKNRIFWEDAYADHNVSFDPATTSFMVWLSKEYLVRITQAGYKVVLANGFYLDIQQPAPTTHYEWVDTWQDLYSNEPFSGPAANLSAAERALVQGGEACMWGEAVEDENIFSRVWVRASGAAERLWSAFNYTNSALDDNNFDTTQSRLIEFRCRLKRRGIHATPIRPDFCPSP